MSEPGIARKRGVTFDEESEDADGTSSASGTKETAMEEDRKDTLRNQNSSTNYKEDEESNILDVIWTNKALYLPFSEDECESLTKADLKAVLELWGEHPLSAWKKE